MAEKRAPEECMDMSEVRREIDRVDEQLVALLAERFGYIERTWQIKKTKGDEGAVVPWRIQQVVDRVRALATKYGMSPDVVEDVWRRLIRYFVQYEDEKISDSGEEAANPQDHQE